MRSSYLLYHPAIGNFYDLHFIVQLNSGGGAHKAGQTDSQDMGNVDPNNNNIAAWSSVYTTQTVYFAVIKDW